jgi:hypothetical protein
MELTEEHKKQFETLIDMYGENPLDESKLLPELQWCLETRSGMRMIRHPLHVTFFHSWKMSNDIFTQKKEEFNKLLAEDKYAAALNYVERPYRLQFLWNWWKEKFIDDEKFRDLLTWVWPDAEPDDTQRQWVRLFNQAYKHGGRVEDEDAPLPPGDPLTVYRGQHKKNALGLAWSLDRKVANLFARRMNTGKKGYIVTATVKRDDVLAYLNGRKEQEVDTDWKNVTVISIEEIENDKYGRIPQD